ncbi:ATP-binding protein [Kitasatospora indigofera]|uniref:ATP-binding protein n=1 Tax=Kitasatospora indigofera TaxID=67307 RepID=UPI0036872526
MSVIDYDRRNTGPVPPTVFSTEGATGPLQRTFFRPLPCEVASVRRYVRQLIASTPSADPYPLDAVLLIVTELFTNAVRHAAHQGQPLLVVVQQQRKSLRLEVHDPDPGMLVAPARPDLADSGRGLLLVDLLSQEWGVVPGATGKMVFAVIARPCR